jgi:hypothetical protein
VLHHRRRQVRACALLGAAVDKSLKACEMHASTTPGSGRSSPGSVCRASSILASTGGCSWSTEDSRYRQGHSWFFELGEAVLGSSVLLALEKLGTLRSIKRHGQCAILVERWSLNHTQVERLTFVKWPEAERNEVVSHTTELRAVGSHVRAGSDRRPAEIGQACGHRLPLIIDIRHRPPGAHLEQTFWP